MFAEMLKAQSLPMCMLRDHDSPESADDDASFAGATGVWESSCPTTFTSCNICP